jgi:hypothetical protein
MLASSAASYACGADVVARICVRVEVMLLDGATFLLVRLQIVGTGQLAKESDGGLLDEGVFGVVGY